MNSHGSKIFLGDLVDAIRELEAVDATTRKQIASVLGFELIQQVADKHKPPEPKAASQVSDVSKTAPEEPSLTPSPTAPNSFSIKLDFIPSETGDWLQGVKPLRRPAKADKGPAAPLRLSPLLLPRWARAILSASLATSAEDGPLDIEKIVETLGKGETLPTLPTLSAPTLRRGVQLLVDQSRSMQPFMRDQVWMQDEILKVVGSDKVKIEYFAGSPLRGAGAGLKPWPAYEPPPAGTPVLLLTDLGICQPMLSNEWADAGEWLQFAQMVGQAKCRLIAFVPYGPSRWPRKLTRVMTLIQWDRSTTAGTVRSLFGKRAEVSGL